MTETRESGAYLPRDAASGKPLQLAMQQLFLTGKILPVGAHLLVRHSFRSAEEKLLEAVYSFVLPRDAALRRFEIRGPDFTVRSALKPTKTAVEEYERGLAQGHLASLARQYRDGLVNLSLGNLRPGEDVSVILEILAGVELRDDGLRFRFPFTLAPSYHSKARIAEVEQDSGEIELPSELFDDVLLPKFRRQGQGLHQVSFDLQLESPWEVQEIGSPSHAISVTKANRVSLAPGMDLPDRDLVLDARTKPGDARALIGGGDGRRHFAAVIPSVQFGTTGQAPRTVVLLLDRSGSMDGTPIVQARKAAAACLSALGPEDRFGLAAFDDTCELFRNELVRATPENRSSAADFLKGIDARGGTELAEGVKRATALLHGSGGDVFIITDGQVFGTEDILESARATGCRLHCLGIGSASQDRFLALLSRETDGISRFVTPRERVDHAALELFASVSRPLASELKIRGRGDIVVAPDPPRSVFSGTPVLLFGDCEGTPALAIEFRGAGQGGASSLEVPIPAEDNAGGETLRLLRGSRLITDFEARHGAGEEGAGKREQKRWEDYLTQLSEQYSLASRSMALVAVVERPGDKPGEPPETHVVPVGMPQDMTFEGVFPPALRSMRLSGPIVSAMAAPLFSHSMQRDSLEDGDFAGEPAYGEASYQEKNGPEVFYDYDACQDAVTVDAGPQDFDLLLELSIQVQPDGGMPGSTAKDRILATLLALGAFLAHGHDLYSGSFRMHVKRLLDYLDRTLPGPLAPEEMDGADRLRAAVRAGKPLQGDWVALAIDVLHGTGGASRRGWESLL